MECKVLIQEDDVTVRVQNINFAFSINFGNQQSAVRQQGYLLLKPHSTAPKS
jgi:hypothetical protein